MTDKPYLKPQGETMDDLQFELYKKLQAFSLDTPETKFTFQQRLAKDNGWSGKFSERVLGEYLKFLLLAMTAGHRIVPSDPVDQAWHLHLQNSRSYWDDLCPNVVGKKLHHQPNPGGRIEHCNHITDYNRTLHSYESIFGHPPPPDIWPSSDIRFGRDTSFVRVNNRQYWLIKKPEINVKQFYFPAFLVTFSLFLIGCSAGEGITDQSDPVLFIYILINLILSFGLAYLLLMFNDWSYRTSSFFRNRDTNRNIILTTDELAYLNGGHRRILELALYKCVQLTYNNPTLNKNDDKSAYWQEQISILNNATHKNNIFQQKTYEKNLVKKGMLIRRNSLFLISCLLLLGISFFFVDVYITTQIKGILVLVALMVTFLGSSFLFSRIANSDVFLETNACKNLINEKQIQIKSKISEVQKLKGKLTGELLNEAIAIMGLDALRHSEFSELTELLINQLNSVLLAPTSNQKSNSNEHGDTSGCSVGDHDSGSSGCGGGCGGCGGD